MRDKKLFRIRVYLKKVSLSGDHSKCEPPDPISNSEVKPFRANDSVKIIHAKVGHRQAFILLGPLSDKYR